MKTPKAGKRKAPKILEEDGSWTAANFWLKVGLSQHQLALVTRLGKEWGLKDSPSAATARRIIMGALANWQAFQAAYESMVRYAKAEGINPEYYLASRAAAELSFLQPLKKDRRGAGSK